METKHRQLLLIFQLQHVQYDQQVTRLGELEVAPEQPVLLTT